ncbi:hypothetical protein [Marmoricola sp. RAF53]|uniref:hypothetical protein n=1 Tax=Marmoricola sp. RAF53 TaxID=3233059 RepID=UPI003F99A2C8
MDLRGALERSVQIPGNGYIETRQFYFSPRGEFLGAFITVVWTDGTISRLVASNTDGVITVEGFANYPDDTLLTVGFSADGRATISYAKGNSRDTVDWYYEADGSAKVHQTAWFTSETGQRSFSQTYWSVAPDGGPFGDVYENLVVLLADGGTQQIETTRLSDGTVTTRIRVVSADGDLVSDEETTVQVDVEPQEPPPTDSTPKRPAPRTGTGTSGGGGFEPTTRTPIPTVVNGGGWIGGGGAPKVEHITDWWYRAPDGHVTFLGSTLKTLAQE